jgi:hypothetical protein
MAKNTLKFEDLVETRQPTIPAGATRVHNPVGMVTQAAVGTMIGGVNEDLMHVAGGDGTNYNWGTDATGPQWSSNPMPRTPSPYDTLNPFDGRGRRQKKF